MAFYGGGGFPPGYGAPQQQMFAPPSYGGYNPYSRPVMGMGSHNNPYMGMPPQYQQQYQPQQQQGYYGQPRPMVQ